VKFACGATEWPIKSTPFLETTTIPEQLTDFKAISPGKTWVWQGIGH